MQKCDYCLGFAEMVDDPEYCECYLISSEEELSRRTPKRCGYCKHWQRNEGFPNGYGICKRPFVPTQDKIFPIALKGAETHERFGCTGLDYDQ